MALQMRGKLQVLSGGRKVGFIADIHLGNHRLFGGTEIGGLNDRFRRGLNVLDAALQYAVDHLDALVILGDLFDTHRPSPQMITAVQRLLGRHTAQLAVYIIRGNHDMAGEGAWDNALGPLYKVACVVDSRAVWLDCYGNKFLLAPYRSGPASVWIKEYIDLIKDFGEGILATHVGIIHSKTPPWLRAAHDAVETAELQGVTTIAGNWHESKTMSNWIQCGALMPTGFDNPSPAGLEPYGRLWWMAPGAGTFDSTIIPGPRFWIKPFETVQAWVTERNRTRLAGCYDFLKIKASPTDVPAAMVLLQDLRKQAVIADGIVEPDASDVALAHKAQVRAVGSATSIDEALVAFLEKEQMPEGVLAPRVGEMTREYIKQAQKHGGR